MSDPSQLVVNPAVIGRRLGLPGAPTTEQVERITDAIIDAQDAVITEVNRPLFADIVTRTGLYPNNGHSDDLLTWKAWRVNFDDDVTVRSATQDTDGSYTVEFLVGLDGPNERAIVRYVTAHASEQIRLDPSSGMGKLAVRSVSAEGQSVSYETTSSGKEAAGALPTLASLRAFKRYGAFRANRPAAPPWPMTTMPLGWNPT